LPPPWGLGQIGVRARGVGIVSIVSNGGHDVRLQQKAQARPFHDRILDFA